MDTQSDSKRKPVEGVKADEFIQLLEQSRNQGFEFVPLVGAGLSAPSGIPIISEVRTYLRKCVAMALGIDMKSAWKPISTTER